MPPSSSMALAHPGAPLAAVVFRIAPSLPSFLPFLPATYGQLGWASPGMAPRRQLCPVPRPLALLGLAPGGYPQVKLKGIAPGFRESPPALLRKERWWCGSW